jgi:hypothetical protein
VAAFRVEAAAVTGRRRSPPRFVPEPHREEEGSVFQAATSGREEMSPLARTGEEEWPG